MIIKNILNLKINKLTQAQYERELKADNIDANQLYLTPYEEVVINDQTPTFTKSIIRDNIISGEKINIIFGKIMKWFSDLKAVAFSGDYNDLENAPNISNDESGGVIYTEPNGKIIARVDADGLKTTAVISDSLVVNDVDVEAKLTELNELSTKVITADDFTVSDGVLTLNFL